jgi:ABC-2 type transport system ATP-binding protein
MSHTTPAISAEGLRKSYGATRALDGLDLTVRAGTVLMRLLLKPSPSEQPSDRRKPLLRESATGFSQQGNHSVTQRNTLALESTQTGQGR